MMVIHKEHDGMDHTQLLAKNVESVVFPHDALLDYTLFYLKQRPYLAPSVIFQPLLFTCKEAA